VGMAEDCPEGYEEGEDSWGVGLACWKIDWDREEKKDVHIQPPRNDNHIINRTRAMLNTIFIKVDPGVVPLVVLCEIGDGAHPAVAVPAQERQGASRDGIPSVIYLGVRGGEGADCVRCCDVEF
jgi:hypothetical protein